mmetsp:Transcript_5490/g.17654  ORF Transcript_5490/g.17654 Transcript_5490/m.17654 type:complete len:83 (-) Transcript_5490:265-513(-)
MCCDDGNEFAVGVCLQCFLFLLVATCNFTVYWIIIPIWLGPSPFFANFHAFAFGAINALMTISYLRAWLSDPGSVPEGWTPE